MKSAVRIQAAFRGLRDREIAKETKDKERAPIHKSLHIICKL